MSAAEIYVGDNDSVLGEIDIETADGDTVLIHFRVRGEVVASAAITDRFGVGVLVGQLMAVSQ